MIVDIFSLSASYFDCCITIIKCNLFSQKCERNYLIAWLFVISVIDGGCVVKQMSIIFGFLFFNQCQGKDGQTDGRTLRGKQHLIVQRATLNNEHISIRCIHICCVVVGKAKYSKIPKRQVCSFF